MSNQDTQNEKETEARINEILIAFAQDFQDFIKGSLAQVRTFTKSWTCTTPTDLVLPLYASCL